MALFVCNTLKDERMAFFVESTLSCISRVITRAAAIRCRLEDRISRARSSFHPIVTAGPCPGELPPKGEKYSEVQYPSGREPGWRLGGMLSGRNGRRGEVPIASTSLRCLLLASASSFLRLILGREFALQKNGGWTSMRVPTPRFPFFCWSIRDTAPDYTLALIAELVLSAVGCRGSSLLKSVHQSELLDFIVSAIGGRVPFLDGRGLPGLSPSFPRLSTIRSVV